MGSESESDDDSEIGMVELEMDSVEVNEGIPKTTDGDPEKVAFMEVNEGIPKTSVKAGGTGSIMENDDSIELEFEKKYQMKDPKSNATAIVTASKEPELTQVDSIENLPVILQTGK
ncbi:hypothetical protein LIER_36011 [Lithospermum erythrorhizon]|uniref:Uncharacterized protein n=1 Tax=Lithospermum erythrorhizon TaxID=34254 RepID=A0AAV3P0D2_LITER